MPMALMQMPWLSRLAWITLSAVGLVTVAGAFAPLAPYLEFANHVRPWVLAGALALLLLAVWVRSGWYRVTAVMVAAVNTALFVLPFAQGATEVASPADTARVGHTLKLITFNILWSNRSTEQIADFLLAEDADIILFQELSQHNAKQLKARLSQNYPHVLVCSQPKICAQGLFSKKPWIEAGGIERTGEHPETVWAVFALPNGQRFRLHGVHSAWPFQPAQQVRDIEGLIAARREIKGSFILAGDMNLTPWSYKLQRFLAETELVRHATLLRSWPAAGKARYLPMPSFLIDHVISTPDIETLSIEIGPPLGSDHLPVIARLRFAG